MADQAGDGTEVLPAALVVTTAATRAE